LAGNGLICLAVFGAKTALIGDNRENSRFHGNNRELRPPAKRVVGQPAVAPICAALGRSSCCLPTAGRACDYPLHLGITEAGGLRSGTVKSSIGLGMMLWSGIGDTIRVSLSADPVEEVKAGFEMLKSLNLRRRGVTVISCPSCARQQFQVIKTVERLEERLAHITTPLTVSVIGCVVNGPGEARETDIGFTGGGNGTHQVYISGLTDHRLKDADIVDHLVELVEKKAAELEAARPTTVEPALEPAK